MFTNTSTGEIKIPKTITPDSVWFLNIILFFVVWGVIFFVVPEIGWFWSLFITTLLLAGAVASGVISVESVDFHGFMIFNPITKQRRVIFPGLHLKLPWEAKEEGSDESLRRLVSSEGIENLPTNDPAENMQLHLTVHARLNVSDVSPEKAADNFIRFHSISKESLTKVVRQEIIKILSAHYSNEKNGEMEKLLDAKKIQEEVFAVSENKKKIEEMEIRWGISIGIILDSSKPDDATKAMKRTPARAEALRTAIKKLMENNGLDQEQARRAALLLDDTAEFKEILLNLDIKAPDLKNLRDVSILPPDLSGGNKKGGHK